MIVSNQLQGVGFSTTGDWEHDFIPNREELDAASDELDSRVKGLVADVGTGGDVAFNAAFVKFQKDWDSWYDPIYWFFPRGRRDELMGFRARFNDLLDWWDKASAAGGHPTSIPKYTERQVGDPKDAPDQWVTVAKWVAGGLIAIAGAVALGQVTGLVKTSAGLLPRFSNPGRRRGRRRRRARGRRRVVRMHRGANYRRRVGGRRRSSWHVRMARYARPRRHSPGIRQPWERQRPRRRRRRRTVRRVRRLRSVSIPRPRRRGGRIVYPWKNAYGRYVYYTAENYPVGRRRRQRR